MRLEEVRRSSGLWWGRPAIAARSVGPLGCKITRDNSTEPAARYLVMFLHRHVEFRLPELEAVAELVLGRGVLRVEPPSSSTHPWSPFRHVWLPSDDAARAIAARALLVKARACRPSKLPWLFFFWGRRRHLSIGMRPQVWLLWVMELGGCRWFQQTNGIPLTLVHVL